MLLLQFSECTFLFLLWIERETKVFSQVSRVPSFTFEVISLACYWWIFRERNAKRSACYLLCRGFCLPRSDNYPKRSPFTVIPVQACMVCKSARCNMTVCFFINVLASGATVWMKLAATGPPRTLEAILRIYLIRYGLTITRLVIHWRIHYKKIWKYKNIEFWIKRFK